MRTPPPLPEEDPRYEPEDPYDEKPGVFPDSQTAVQRLATWVGAGAVVWLILLGLIWATVVVVRNLF